jgi:hypothetical protein
MNSLHSLLLSARARAGALSAISLLAMILAGAAGQKWA